MTEAVFLTLGQRRSSHFQRLGPRHKPKPKVQISGGVFITTNRIKTKKNMLNLKVQHRSTLQMFAGNCRNSAGGFLQYLQRKPCNIYRIAGIAGFSLQILQKTPAESLQFPANICSVLQINGSHLKSLCNITILIYFHINLDIY